MELRSIRRATSAHVVATHGYCMQAGGPKMVFSAGADGLQVMRTFDLQLRTDAHLSSPHRADPRAEAV